MQDERQPFRRRQRVEDDEQREADRIRQQRLVFRVVPAVDADDRLGQPRPRVLLSARVAGPEHVEADTRDDGREPPAEVVDRGALGPVQAKPGLLHRVLGLADRAEHPVRDGIETRAVTLEFLCHQLTPVRCHIAPFASVIPLTSETRQL